MVDTDQLAELSRLAEALNKETDTYTEALAQLEKKLRKMNLGVEAWVCLFKKREHWLSEFDREAPLKPLSA